jgi:hypothetical protein
MTVAKVGQVNATFCNSWGSTDTTVLLTHQEHWVSKAMLVLPDCLLLGTVSTCEYFHSRLPHLATAQAVVP